MVTYGNFWTKFTCRNLLLAFFPRKIQYSKGMFCSFMPLSTFRLINILTWNFTMKRIHLHKNTRLLFKLFTFICTLIPLEVFYYYCLDLVDVAAAFAAVFVISYTVSNFYFIAMLDEREKKMSSHRARVVMKHSRVFQQCAVDETNRKLNPLRCICSCLRFCYLLYMFCVCVHVCVCPFHTNRWQCDCFVTEPTPPAERIYLIYSANTHRIEWMQNAPLNLGSSKSIGNPPTDTVVHTRKSNAVPTNTNRNTMLEMLYTKWLRMRHNERAQTDWTIKNWHWVCCVRRMLAPKYSNSFQHCCLIHQFCIFQFNGDTKQFHSDNTLFINGMWFGEQTQNQFLFIAGSKHKRFHSQLRINWMHWCE